MFGFQPTAQNPQADVQQFIREFESDYGQGHPPFVISSYEQVREHNMCVSEHISTLDLISWQAVSQARQDLKFLLVYLHSPAHQDTPRFSREVLCSQQLVDFVAGQLLVWGISVHSEEGVSSL